MAQATSVYWNGSFVVNAKSRIVLEAEFWDEMVVIIGFNRSNGDYFVLNYLGADRETPVSPIAHYREFFHTEGEKSALLLGCNKGSWMKDSAQRTMDLFSADMHKWGVNVVRVDASQLAIESAPRTVHKVTLESGSGEVTLVSRHGKQKLSPFEKRISALIVLPRELIL